MGGSKLALTSSMSSSRVATISAVTRLCPSVSLSRLAGSVASSAISDPEVALDAEEDVGQLAGALVGIGRTSARATPMAACASSTLP